MDCAQKRGAEKQVLEKMLLLYCGGKRHEREKGQSLCPRCALLLAYANQRTDACPRMAVKTFCSQCPTHCYRPDMREQVRAVMRYAGPRMLWRSPLLAVRHMLAPRLKNRAARKETR